MIDLEQQLNSILPLFGHRNWIVVADSAYPAQSKPGIETMVAGGDQIEVVRKVRDAIAACAHVGANVYAGDFLTTYDGGTLRLRVGAGQLFMLASSNANITQDHAIIDMLIKSGTAGFSATDSDPLEIDTPVGTLRPADESRAFGQVTIADQRQVLITSYQGTLSLTRNGEKRLIEAGKSYRVALAPAAAAAAAASPQAPSGSGANGNSGQWIFDGIVVGGAALTGYALWTIFCESPSTPSN